LSEKSHTSMAAYTEQHLSNDDVLVTQLTRVVEIQSWVFLRRGKNWAIFDKTFHDSSFIGIDLSLEVEVSVCSARSVLCYVGLVETLLHCHGQLRTETA